jgi:hypothetical protein
LFKKDRTEREKLNRDYSKTEGIEEEEIQRRKSAGECLHCAWPPYYKGTHRVKDCIRPIQLDKGTARIPKDKSYQELKSLEKFRKDNSSTSPEGRSDDLL